MTSEAEPAHPDASSVGVAAGFVRCTAPEQEVAMATATSTPADASLRTDSGERVRPWLGWFALAVIIGM